jgi:hypothetical protein
MCLTLSFVFGWLTLRSGSLIPAAIAQTLYNVAAYSNVGPPFHGKGRFALLFGLFLGLPYFAGGPLMWKAIRNSTAIRCYRIRLRKSVHPFQPNRLGIHSKRQLEFESIIEKAGEPGDRWLGHCKMAGREESPDTIVLGPKGPVTNDPSGALRRPQGKWATRQVTPGERFGWRRFRPLASGLFTESATENRPPAEQHGGIAQVNLRDAFEMRVSFGKGEKVG